MCCANIYHIGRIQYFHECRGKLVYILIEHFTIVYNKYFRYKETQKILYVQMLKALYRTLISSIMYHKNFRNYISGIRFEVYTYNICVANHMKYGKQQKLTCHVDGFKSSHLDTKVLKRW